VIVLFASFGRFKSANVSCFLRQSMPSCLVSLVSLVENAPLGRAFLHPLRVSFGAGSLGFCLTCCIYGIVDLEAG
jgi:hypothetical protein